MVTFFLIGAYWINHHRMFNLLEGVDHTFLILNVFFLMSIAIIPFPNALFAEYIRDPEVRGVSAAVFGLAMAVLAAMFNAVWWYAGWKGRLLKSHVDQAAMRKVLNSYLVGPVAYGIGTALSFFAPIIAIALYVVVPFGYLMEGPIGHIDHEPRSVAD
jgi:uncharacterized membrane protein